MVFHRLNARIHDPEPERWQVGEEHGDSELERVPGSVVGSAEDLVRSEGSHMVVTMSHHPEK